MLYTVYGDNHMAKLRVKQLLQAMNEAGLSSSTMWLRWNEDNGNITSPRLPNGRGDRVYTKKQIEEIVRAFSPGGKGRWP